MAIVGWANAALTVAAILLYLLATLANWRALIAVSARADFSNSRFMAILFLDTWRVALGRSVDSTRQLSGWPVLYGLAFLSFAASLTFALLNFNYLLSTDWAALGEVKSLTWLGGHIFNAWGMMCAAIAARLAAEKEGGRGLC